VDCGAGIGRISKHLLLKNFENIEMVDVNSNFIEKAKEYLGPDDAKRVNEFHCCGLENFNPNGKKYDCIWIQWVAGGFLLYFLLLSNYRMEYL
jgi:protein N-terminal methyltransferase